VNEPSATAAANVTACIARLEAVFADVATTRMAGVPVLHPGLQVRAVGFAPEAGPSPVLCGVLVTPWFMNLLRLPLNAAAAASMLAPGAKAERNVGPRCFEFIGAVEPALGRYEASSLYSPMFEFADQAAALATAHAVLALLRPAPATLPSTSTTTAASAAPARRGFLFGRTAAGGAP
jgi:[NiFe] hydrogenase assembly HybE family chaperone